MVKYSECRIFLSVILTNILSVVLLSCYTVFGSSATVGVFLRTCSPALFSWSIYMFFSVCLNEQINDDDDVYVIQLSRVV